MASKHNCRFGFFCTFLFIAAATVFQLLLTLIVCATAEQTDAISDVTNNNNAKPANPTHNPYAAFMKDWDRRHRSSFNNYCFFSPMNCEPYTTPPYAIKVPADLVEEFIRELNLYKEQLKKAQKQQKQAEQEQKNRQQQPSETAEILVGETPPPSVKQPSKVQIVQTTNGSLPPPPPSTRRSSRTAGRWARRQQRDKNNNNNNSAGGDVQGGARRRMRMTKEMPI